MKPKITKDIEIETLVRNYPFSIRYLADKGIKCIACGEPIWGTLQEVSFEKGISKKELDIFIKELNRMSRSE